jgi:hypothetical protein
MLFMPGQLMPRTIVQALRSCAAHCLPQQQHTCAVRACMCVHTLLNFAATGRAATPAQTHKVAPKQLTARS